jgi:hypothetical protein
MKTRSSLPALAFLVFAALLATTRSSSAVVPDHGPSAFGEGSFFFFNGVQTERWTYSFDAASNKNGQTRGRATFDIVENFVQTHVVVKIDCLNVTSDASILTAVMTGTVLRSDDPNYPKRANVLFVAEDHGVNPDLITPLFVSGGDCHTSPLPLTLLQQPPDAIHIQP